MDVIICEDVRDMLGKFQALRGPHEFLRMASDVGHTLFRDEPEWAHVFPYGLIYDFISRGEHPYSRLRYWLISNINSRDCPQFEDRQIAGIFHCRNWDFHTLVNQRRYEQSRVLVERRRAEDEQLSEGSRPERIWVPDGVTIASPAINAGFEVMTYTGQSTISWGPADVITYTSTEPPIISTGRAYSYYWVDEAVTTQEGVIPRDASGDIAQSDAGVRGTAVPGQAGTGEGSGGD